MTARDRIAELLDQVKVVSHEEAETVDYVCCMPAEVASPFADDVLTTCSACNRRIRHRPHVPKTPPKICFPCATGIAKAN